MSTQPDDPHARIEITLRNLVTATVAVLFYATVLFYSYRDIVSPLYASEGLTYRSPDPARYAVAVLLCVIVAINLPTRISRPSHFGQWIMFVTVAAPGILIAQYMQALAADEATKYALAIAGTMILIRIATSPRLSIGRRHLPQVPESSVWLILGIIAVAVYGILIGTIGISLQWVSFDNVYSVRADYKSAAASVPLIGYLLPMVYNVVNPIFMARGIYAGRWVWFLAGAFGQVIVYLTTGQKAVLLSSVALVSIAWLFRYDLRLRGNRLLVAVASMTFAAIALDKIFNTEEWNSLITRRFIIFPGAIGVAYVAVFKDRPKGDFAGAPLFWLQPHDGLGPSYLVGKFLTGNPLNNANVGLFGHGYYNYGYLGIFLEGLIAALFLLAADAAAKGIPTPVASLILFQPFMAVASASIFTTILTHSYLPALIVCSLLPRTGWGRRNAAQDGPHALLSHRARRGSERDQRNVLRPN